MKMKITYKDVGQGDSILLEWEEDGAHKIGIIDCNLKGRLNPVLKHIRDAKYKIIEFIILSHPHRDHYSGMLQLLKYCEKEKIVIKALAHTLMLAGNTKFWKYFEVASSDTRQLSKLIRKWKELRIQGIISQMVALIDGKPFRISQKLTLECLSPSHNDAEIYQTIVQNDADVNTKAASQAANHLSTVFKMQFSDCSVLFTSDAESSALEGIIEREIDCLEETVFHLCQLPHHGSNNNHYPGFWNLIKTAEVKHAIVSAGEHKSYDHPSIEVIKSFHDDGYLIHCTNIVNGMNEYVELLEELSKASAELDAGSELAEEYRKPNDRTFVLQDGKVICI